MGFADKDPIMSTTDYTSGVTSLTASTSGTSGCRNWDFVDLLKEEQNHYIAENWELLSEEAFKGEGEHLLALSSIMGCSPSQTSEFQKILIQNKEGLFPDSFRGKNLKYAQHTRLQLTQLIRGSGIHCSTGMSSQSKAPH